MPDGPLKNAIEALGKRCGFPLNGVFIMDGSKRSTKANAFFTGFGKRKKIALYDTLIQKCSEEQLLGVLAHEIGHFRCGHIKKRLAAGIIQTAALFFLLGLATDPTGLLSRILFDAFGVHIISTHVGLVLFALLMAPFNQILSLFFNLSSRIHEFEADAYAAAITGNPKALATILTHMSADHLSHPSPSRLEVWLHYSHPPLLQRLRALETMPQIRTLSNAKDSP
jgi:STE24 endopeptidase